MNPTPEEEREALIEPKPAADDMDRLTALLRESSERKAALLAIQEEVRVLKEKHAAALMQCASAIRTANLTADTQTKDATAARGQAACLARVVRTLLDAISGCEGRAPNMADGLKFEEARAEATAALAAWDMVND